MRPLTLLLAAGLLAACSEVPTGPQVRDEPGMLVVGSGGPFTQVSVHVLSTCALEIDTSIACWGDDYYGQVSGPSAAGTGFTQVSPGAWHVCALRGIDGSIACWGPDASVIPLGTWPNWGQVSGPAAAGPGFTQVSSGWLHTCALRGIDGSIACWGYDHVGQVSGPAAAGPGFTHVSVSNEQTCALRTDTSIACWGNDVYGLVSGAAAAGTGFTQMTLGTTTVCGVKTDTSITCWGTDAWGQVSGATAAGTGFTQVTAGVVHNCALRGIDGSIACWGFELDGEISGPVAAGTGFTQVSAKNAAHTCALRDGSIECWGNDEFGQVSGWNTAPTANDDAYSTDQDVPLVVAAPEGVLANDTDADGAALTVQLVAGPANGSLTLNTDGSFTYTPTSGFYGSVSFTYKANDGLVDSNEATVSITVNRVIPVTIVIGPDKKESPNTINTKSNGLVSVAILGDPGEFALTDVDWTTLAFGPAGATAAHDLSDPATWSSHVVDVNGDGIPDLVAHFSQKATGLTSGDTEACLTGMIDGVTVRACGDVIVR